MPASRALIVSAPDRFDLGGIAMPAPGPGLVQVRTLHSLISAGTERWVAAGRFTWAQTPFPMVPGYQRVGVVEACGPGVDQVRPGDVVSATMGVWDGPVPPFWGAHLAVANSPAAECRRLPAGVDPLDAAGLVVAQVGLNAAERIAMAAGDWVAVWGDGLIGLCAAQAARARGARVVVVGRHGGRLAAARAVGVEAVVDAHGDAIAGVRAAIGAERVHAVIDTVQSEASQRVFVELLAEGGQIVASGFTPGTCWADMALLQQRQLTMHFVQGWTAPRMQRTLDLMASGAMRLRPLVSHVVDPDDAPRACRMIVDRSAPFTGIAITWSRP